MLRKKKNGTESEANLDSIATKVAFIYRDYRRKTLIVKSGKSM